MMALLLLPAWTLRPASAGATNLIVGGVPIPPGTYLANGSAVTSASKPAAGGYIYYDGLTSTLTMENAQIGTAGVITAYISALVYCSGDLTVVLSGTNTLSFNDSSINASAIYAEGALTIQGSGNANVTVHNTRSNSTAFAINAGGDLSVLSGNLAIIADAEGTAIGMRSFSAFLFAGGKTDITAQADSASGVFAIVGDFRMTGGQLKAVAKSAAHDGYGVYGKTLLLEGGEGFFEVSGANGYGGGFWGYVNSYSGGVFTFIGEGLGLMFGGGDTEIAYTLAGDGAIFASESTDGSQLKRWYTIADGKLEGSYTTTSPFRYVLFKQYTEEEMPQTSDGQTPWGLALIAGLCLLLGAGMLAIRGSGKRA